jgi:hypothetical protein
MRLEKDPNFGMPRMSPSSNEETDVEFCYLIPNRDEEMMNIEPIRSQQMSKYMGIKDIEIFSK